MHNYCTKQLFTLEAQSDRFGYEASAAGNQDCSQLEMASIQGCLHFVSFPRDPVRPMVCMVHLVVATVSNNRLPYLGPSSKLILAWSIKLQNVHKK